MAALERLLPAARLVETERADVSAGPGVVWERVRHGDLGRSPLIRALFLLRTVPDRLSGASSELRLRIDDLVSSPERPGFQILVDDPPREIVVGAIGKVWKPSIPFVHVAGAEGFEAFSEPGFVKVAWAIGVAEHGRRTRITFEVRVDATDDVSWRRFRRYFRIIGPGSRLIRRSLLAALERELDGHGPRAEQVASGAAIPRTGDWRDILQGIGGASRMVGAFLTPFFRRSRSRWGLDDAGAGRRYPGDELVPEPGWGYTHGIEIDAPPEAVWPYIAQIGADRGGFYSYQWLENLVGCRVRNAEAPNPEWEARQGDEMVLHPDMPPLRLVDVQKGRWLIAHAPADEAARSAGKPWTTVSWLFLVEPLEGSRSRFVSRFRSACSGDLLSKLAFGPTLTEPISFAMDRRMLLGVKALAQRPAEPTVLPETPAPIVGP